MPMPEPEPKAPADRPELERRVSAAGLRVERAKPKAKPAPAPDAPDPDDDAEAEAGGEGDRQIVGHAVVYDEWTTLYEGRYFTWREVVRPGACKNAIAEGQDVRMLFNHDSNFVLGRTKSGTCEMTEDARGLLTRCTPPDTQTVRDLVLVPIGRGDVDGMSFAFSVRQSGKTVVTETDDTTVIDRGGERLTIRRDGDREVEEREILDVDLYDVSAVTYPAYTGTDVACRATLGADVETRARLRDVPHRRPAPKRDEVRRWLETARPGGGRSAEEHGRQAGKADQ